MAMALVLVLEQVGSRLVPVEAAQLPPGAHHQLAVGGGSSRRAAAICCAGAGPRHRGGWSAAAMEVALGVARAGGEGMGVRVPDHGDDDALKAFVHDFKENFRPMTMKEMEDAGMKFSEDKALVAKDIIKAEILLRDCGGGYIREDVLVDAIAATSAAGQVLRPVPSYDNPAGTAVYQPSMASTRPGWHTSVLRSTMSLPIWRPCMRP
uniref:Uncharacterized protein n=1 Tax=Oryza meridionalis TaxID=40149 RepID=A0A0E0EES2_9ORYZ